MPTPYKPATPSTPTKPGARTEPSKPAAPAKPAAAPPVKPGAPEVIKDKTFDTDKDIPMVFFGTFENCTFNLKELKGRNFNADFNNCKFAKDFKFVECNLHGCVGIPKDVKMEKCMPPQVPARKGKGV